MNNINNMEKLTLNEKLEALKEIKNEKEKIKEKIKALTKEKRVLKKGISLEKQKKLYDLFHEYGGMKNIEYVAKRVGYSVTTAKTLLSKIRKKIVQEKVLEHQDD